MFSIFFSDNRSANEIMSKNMVEPEKPYMTIWRRVACWISKATRVQAHARTSAPTPTHALTQARTQTEICNTYCFSMATLISLTRVNVTLYVHCLDCLSCTEREGFSCLPHSTLAGQVDDGGLLQTWTSILFRAPPRFSVAVRHYGTTLRWVG